MTQPELPIDFSAKPEYTPVSAAMAGARQFVVSRGGEYTPPSAAVRSPKVLHFATAHAYETQLRGPEHPDVAAAYDAFARDTHAQYQHMTGAMGITHEVVAHDPYSSPQEMAADVAQGRIKTMATATTGSHPYLSDQTNDEFRATHDVFGHAAIGSTFSRHGEERAWQSHRQMYSAEAQPALTSETRGQNSVLIRRGSFPEDQSAGTMPHWTETLSDRQFANVMVGEHGPHRPDGVQGSLL